MTVKDNTRIDIELPHINVLLDINGERWDFKNAGGSAWILKYDANGSPYLLADGTRIVIGRWSDDNPQPEPEPENICGQWVGEGKVCSNAATVRLRDSRMMCPEHAGYYETEADIHNGRTPE